MWNKTNTIFSIFHNSNKYWRVHHKENRKEKTL